MPLSQKSLEQISEEDLAALIQHSSAKRMDVNSRGCQPTVLRRRTFSTRKGSHNELFGPFRAGSNSTAVPWVAPTAIHVVRLRRTCPHHVARLRRTCPHHVVRPQGTTRNRPRRDPDV